MIPEDYKGDSRNKDGALALSVGYTQFDLSTAL